MDGFFAVRVDVIFLISAYFELFMSYCQMWCMEIMQWPVDESPFLSPHR